MNKYDYIVYLGRFQPIHNGHLKTIKAAYIQTKNLIIVIGSANQARTPKNPFTADERQEMINMVINSIHPDYGTTVSFIHIEDRLYNDDKWLAYLQTQINLITGNKKVAIIGHDKDGSSSYLRQNFQNMDFIETGPYIKETEIDGKVVSSSKIRELMFSGDVGYTASNLPVPIYRRMEVFTKTDEFNLLGGEYDHIRKEEEMVKNLPFGMTFYTTDSVVVQSGHILLVQRSEHPGKHLWALPGVHVGLNETVEEASIRALLDETHLKVPLKALKGSLVGVKRFDHPERSLRARLTEKNARTITEAFFYKLDSSTPLPTNVRAGKGIRKVWWYSLGELDSLKSQMFEDHYSIIDHFIF